MGELIKKLSDTAVFWHGAFLQYDITSQCKILLWGMLGSGSIPGFTDLDEIPGRCSPADRDQWRLVGPYGKAEVLDDTDDFRIFYKHWGCCLWYKRFNLKVIQQGA